MKTGIIGLPQVGKTSLFKILTRVNVEERGYSREAHIGIAKVPDDRLDRLAALFNPKKLIHATVEYADVAAVSSSPACATWMLSSTFSAPSRTKPSPTSAPSIRCAMQRTLNSNS
jgi:hypothetical protein